MRQFIGAAIAAGSLGAACASGPCEEFGAPQGVAAASAQQAELIASGGVLCRASAGSATVDYPAAEDPLLAAVDHLEPRGWARRGEIRRGGLFTLARGVEVVRLSHVEGKRRIVYDHETR